MKYILIMFLFLFTGCATSVYNLPYQERQNITWRVFDYPYEDVFSASIDQLQTGQGILQNVDRQTGIITTDWLQDDSAMRQILIGGQRTRLNLNVDSLDTNRTRMDVRLYWQSQGNFGSWTENAITKQTALENISPFFTSIDARLRGEEPTATNQ